MECARMSNPEFPQPPDANRRPGGPVVAGSAPLDFDLLIGDSPAAQRAARTARTVAAFGDKVRRARTVAHLSQAVLAERAGITQAHLSELERGLGRNGPTVGMLSRLMYELDDELLFDTARSRAGRQDDARRYALSLISELTARIVREGADDKLGTLIAALEGHGAAVENGTALYGVLQGMVMGLRAATALGLAERVTGTAGSAAVQKPEVFELQEAFAADVPRAPRATVHFG
jgi:transcriptional regulator with XRE-family HTH domain